MVQGNVRSELMKKLGCEMPQIGYQGKNFYLLIPPSADNIVGVETDQDIAFKTKAKEYGLDDLEWVHAQRPIIQPIYTPLAGYVIEPSAFQGRPRTILLRNQDMSPWHVVGNVRAQLMMKLNCEMPQIEDEGKNFYLLIPPSADNLVGVETDQDIAFKTKAREYGLDDLEWTHIKNPIIQRVLVSLALGKRI
ncbi:hypothetical protein FRC10_009155 [Ceratobasidium sp. 414]|nr:hypothetical protein FRC10_009155 [Ceratobasidium sp. 414]